MLIEITTNNIQIPDGETAWLCQDDRNNLADLIIDRCFDLALGAPETDADEKINTTKLEAIKVKLVDESSIDGVDEYGNGAVILILTPEEICTLKRGNRIMVEFTYNDKFMVCLINLKALRHDLAINNDMMVKRYGVVLYADGYSDALLPGLESTVMETFGGINVMPSNNEASE